MSKTRENHEEWTAAAWDGSPYGARPAEGRLLQALRVIGRVVGYALLTVAAFAVSVALGACVAVALEYLVGWPDTWWL